MTRTLLAAALLFATTHVATAQPSPEEAKKLEAKTLYEKGNTHYNLGEYDQAVTAFKKAYELSQAPGLLFNIAQSFRLKKDYEQASHFYSTYLRLKPDAPNRADVEARIAEMNNLIEEQKKMGTKAPIGTVTPDGGTSNGPSTPPPTGTGTGTTPPPTGTGTTTTTLTGPTGPGPTDSPSGGGGKGLKLAGIATAAGGGLFLITGVVFGMSAKSKESELEELNAGGTWDQGLYDKGQRNNTIAIASLVVGGAAVAAGGVMYFLGSKKSKERASMAVVPRAGGAEFAVGWKF
ncbi:MAG: tetratricopeptide repeat protein [Kofleriaceae bacterium]|nr:tetratricopeptide repeat protein [Kofleriaceae bacterium]